MRSLRLAAVLALALAAVPAGWAGKGKRPRLEDMINFQLGVEYSQWLVGPLYYMASSAERQEFLSLTSDAAAGAFAEEFWRRRDPEPEIFGNPALELFERRAAEADRRYREQAVIGRRTDRGAVYVLHGEPAQIHFDPSPQPGEPDLEIWVYPKGAATGLDGASPERFYYFAEQDGRTAFYTPRASRRMNLPH